MKISNKKTADDKNNSTLVLWYKCMHVPDYYEDHVGEADYCCERKAVGGDGQTQDFHILNCGWYILLHYVPYKYTV